MIDADPGWWPAWSSAPRRRWRRRRRRWPTRRGRGVRLHPRGPARDAQPPPPTPPVLPVLLTGMEAAFWLNHHVEGGWARPTWSTPRSRRRGQRDRRDGTRPARRGRRRPHPRWWPSGSRRRPDDAGFLDRLGQVAPAVRAAGAHPGLPRPVRHALRRRDRHHPHPVGRAAEPAGPRSWPTSRTSAGRASAGRPRGCGSPRPPARGARAASAPCPTVRPRPPRPRP